MPSPLALCVAALLLVNAETAGAQAPYRLTILDIEGAALGYASDINAAGNVAITDSIGANAPHIYFWDGKELADLGPGLANALNNRNQIVGTSPRPGAVGSVWDVAASTRVTFPAGTSLEDINDRGQIAGYYQVPGESQPHAAIWQGAGFGERIELGQGLAFAINNAGQATGFDSYHPVAGRRWDGSVTDLIDPGFFVVGQAINERGQVALYSPSRGRSLIWDGAEFSMLDQLGAWDSRVGDLNDAGVAVGAYSDEPFFGRAAIWNGSVGLDLNTLLRPESVAAGWILTGASAINDAGSIVGQAYNVHECRRSYECEYHAFVLSISDLPDQVLTLAPIPEPSTYALMLAGLAALAWRGRRRGG